MGGFTGNVLHVHNRIVKAHGVGGGNLNWCALGDVYPRGSASIRGFQRKCNKLDHGRIVPGTKAAENEPAMVAQTAASLRRGCRREAHMCREWHSGQDKLRLTSRLPPCDLRCAHVRLSNVSEHGLSSTWIRRRGLNGIAS